MYRILTLNKIAACGVNQLPASAYQVSDQDDAPDGIVLRSFSMHEMALPDSLKGVARAGAGVNNIPLDACAEKGIVVFNTPGANANAVKELVIGGLIMASRKITEGIAWAQGLHGQPDVAKLVEKGKGEFVGPEIAGKTLGVVGLGAIGVLVANAAAALGMQVLGYDPFITEEQADRLAGGVKIVATLDEVYAGSDYITLHVPVVNETKKMINQDALGKMKNDVRILNMARGELVDNAALKQALESGKAACYVTDFPNEEVLGVKGIIPIPHLGASTPESEDNCAVMAVAQLKSFLETGNVKNAVNYPDCELAYSGKKRICVTHKNDPSMVASLTAALEKKGLGVAGIASKSKGNYGYTIIDVEQNEVNGADEDIRKAANVISVRVI